MGGADHLDVRQADDPDPVLEQPHEVVEQRAGHLLARDHDDHHVVEHVGDRVGLAPAVVAGAAALLYAYRARYPRADWRLNVDVDAHGTTALAAPAELRAGRWAGNGKTECGLHL